MARLNKIAFKHFVETECERRLFWDLCDGDPSWMAPVRKRILPEYERTDDANLGHVWEQKVYEALRQLPGTHADLDAAGDVNGTIATAATFAGLIAEAASHPLILLEYQWTPPEAFFKSILGVAPSASLPIVLPVQQVRPDIHIVSKADWPGPREIRPDGSLHVLTPAECAARLAIRILDVKHTSEHGVGRSHFVELLFYAHALSHWIYSEGLEDRFFVSADGHGIFPCVELPSGSLTVDKVLQEICVPLKWESAHVLFSRSCERIRAMTRRRPLDVDQISVRIQPSCGSCNYLSDCKVSLKRGSSDPGDWDLRLLPYTSPSTAEMLRTLEKLDTVRDVATKLAPNAPHGGYDPLYAERPMLRLKAKAVMANKRIPISGDVLDGQRHLNMSMPRYDDQTLLFNLEADRTHDIVFGAGLRFESRCIGRAAYRGVYTRWWAAWSSLLTQHRTCDDFVKASIDVRTALDADYLATLANVPVDKLLAQAARALWFLNESGTLEIPPVDPDDKDAPPPRVSWSWQYITDGVEPMEELELVKDLLRQLVAIISFSDVMEGLMGVLVQSTFDATKTYPRAPRLGVYYWSQEQVSHAQDMLERHVQRLNADPELRAILQHLLLWLSPSESQVAHYDHPQKVFNLRMFVETTQALPHLINATWHEMMSSEFHADISNKFWAPHFNYMDYALWQTAIDEGNVKKRRAKQDEIAAQFDAKLSGMFRILTALRPQVLDNMTLGSSKPISALTRRPTDEAVHTIARTWYMFACLNATTDELAKEEVRASYPSRGIGRLYAAEVENLVILPVDGDFPSGGASFDLHGMSAQIRSKEGDRMLLLPDSQRDARNLDHWIVELAEMRFDATRRCYQCRAVAKHKVFLQTVTDQGAALYKGPIYLYPTSGDIWSGRLLDNKDSLLKRNGWRNGKSWLGHRASFLMGLEPSSSVPEPEHLTFALPEVYLYAPGMLPSVAADPQDSLRTTAWPPPDDSQQAAIRAAMANTICCLQGPPGTGKSQTLAALVDEFILRAGRPVRILVTAFSYDAMIVLARKLIGHTDHDGKATAAVSIEKVFLRSAERELGVEGVRELVFDGSTMVLDGVELRRHGGRRLEDNLAASFVMFANAHSLYKLGLPSGSKSNQYDNLKNDFGFDLIIVDEASQLPTDQFLPIADLVLPGKPALRFLEGEPTWKHCSTRQLAAATLDNLPARCTKLVVVGDQFQLPPVQQVKPPRKLMKVLGSLFHYFLDGHQLPVHQLEVNYRSTDTIVEYTRSLGFYTNLRAFHKSHPYPPLPPVPAGVEAPWLRHVLDGADEVHALVHRRENERATSDIEAVLAADTVAAFFDQMAVDDADKERVFWAEHVGVVAPHNAQGRRIMLEIKSRLAGDPRRSFLDDDELDTLMRRSVYSVEKFQGSDRTFILASMGISARDQLTSEEEFIFGLNRFNVLSSRAKQKMLLLCSQSFLEYIPADRDIMECAARIRAFATDFCNVGEPTTVTNELGVDELVEWRHRVVTT